MDHFVSDVQTPATTQFAAGDVDDHRSIKRLVLLAWIPIQKKKPNRSPDFLPYFRI
jgi:hypothetical protein